MTAIVVQDVLEKAMFNPTFGQQLVDDPQATLAPYEGLLTAEEIAAITATAPAVVHSAQQVARARPDAQPWLRPTSFKEAASAILSLVLIILLLYAAVVTYLQVNVDPRPITVGDTVTVVDSFARARDLLNIFFPLFSAVVTFWLGVAVESRRADRSEQVAAEARADQQQTAQEAQTAKHEKEQAQSTAAQVKATAQTVLAKVATVAATRLGLPDVSGAIGGLESGAAAGTPDPAALQAILSVIEQGQEQLSEK